MSRYILLPVFEGDPMTIKLPPGLVTNELYDSAKDKVSDREKLKWLIQSLARNNISATWNGNVCYKDTELNNVNLSEVVTDCCNNKFYEKYEKFYDILRKCNITF